MITITINHDPPISPLRGDSGRQKLIIIQGEEPLRRRETEDSWLLRQMRETLNYAGVRNPVYLDNWEAQAFRYQGHLQADAYAWWGISPDKRMAAIVLASRRKVANQLKAGLKYIRESDPDYIKLLPMCQKAVSDGDYEVDISG